MNQRSTQTRNVVVFGQTGAGKSSLVNLLAQKEVAKVSSSVSGCTASNQSFDISPNADNIMYKFWDTPGLNEGEQGTVSARNAIGLLYNLVKGCRTIDLVIYCVRGARLVGLFRVNYDLFWGIMCERKVPIVLVVTGLEQEGDMDQWWTNYEKVIKGMGMTFEGHACVTTTKGRNNLYEQEYLQSADKVWALVQEHCLPDPITLTAEWISEVPKRMEAYMREYNARTGKERKHLPKPQRFGKGSLSKRHNIILFGETGVGKSSVVNMILGENAAPVSNTLMGCTFENTSYETWIGTRPGTHSETPVNNSSIETRIPFRVYDTAGLNEGEQGRVPHWKAVKALYTLIRQLDGVSLLIYCTRRRFKENSRANWNLFHKVICAEQVPAVVVVTGVEHEENLRNGTLRGELMAATKEHQILPNDLACIVPIRGKLNEHAELYEWSQKTLRNLIALNYRREPWSTNTDEWLSRIYHQVYKTGCFSSTTHVEFVDTTGDVISHFIKETGMEREDEERLRKVLLQAEKKSRKRFFFTV